MNLDNITKRLKKMEQILIIDNYDRVVFSKPGESLEKYRIGPDTVVFIDDIDC
ncbi:MAG TPA: hypothetical protein VNM69_18005 [Bacillus sp. (in: firmicutes)]|nr:hypothetical protein [Bacillus sp. (in: firmicutes)]